jgi:hypothetical protein
MSLAHHRAMRDQTRHRVVWLCAAALGLGSGCVDRAGSHDSIESLSAGPVCAIVTVNLDGSFSPSTIDLDEGSCVEFEGPNGAPLRTTDAVVQVTELQASLAMRAGVSCMTGGRAYDITSMLPGEDNELTGPLRRGTSGVYALGPEEAEGYYEGPSSYSCVAIGAANGSAPATADEIWRETRVPGALTKLCRKHGVSSDKATSTNSRFLLPSTWDNPDITGGVVRINWRELYTVTLVNGVEIYTKDYSKLDTELASAARRGKLVLLEVLAGAGIPSWLFTDYPTPVDASATGLVAKSAVPIKTSDFGTSSTTSMPTARNCGYEKTMGSPADDAYKSAVLAMLRDLASHIRSNAQHFQALGSFKVTGLNFLTGEMRLPKRCLDPSLPNQDNGNPQDSCWCNTRIWAAPLGISLPAYIPKLGDPAAPLVTGAGYTAAKAQNFLNAVENTLYVELGKRKTMHFMLIQDGLPKVLDSTHYDMETLSPTSPWFVGTWPLGVTHAPNFGYVDAAGAPIPFDQQTIDALDNGQRGDFRAVNADGSPNPSGGGADAPALFALMHAGLGTIPIDGAGLSSCPQRLPLVGNLDGKIEAILRQPGSYSSVLSNANYGSAGSGCPNKWAVREGFEGQINGFQTQNDFTSSDDLSSALWNAAINSNAVFVEAYEAVLWKAEQERRRGNAVLSTTVAGHAQDPSYQYSLAQWTALLHKRRRTIAGFAANATNRHMADPFPDHYVFTFNKDLAPNVVESYRFINPAARCASGTLASGRINVRGL